MSRLTEWFATLATPNKAVMILVAIGLLVIAGVTALHVIDTLAETAEQKGAVAERAAAQAQTLDNLEKANAAKQHYRSNPAVRHDDCLLDATNPEDC